MQIFINRIDIEESLFPRSAVSDYFVNNYTEAYQAQAEFPPIVVASKGKYRYTLLDGRHRLAAVTKLGRTTIAALITQVDESRYFEEAVRLNVSNGQPLTLEERLNCARRLKSQGYDFTRISRLVAITEQTLLQYETPNGKVQKLTPSRIRDRSSEGSGVVLAAKTLDDAFAMVIQAFESMKVPDRLRPLANRLHRAMLVWEKKR